MQSMVTHVPGLAGRWCRAPWRTAIRLVAVIGCGLCAAGPAPAEPPFVLSGELAASCRVADRLLDYVVDFTGVTVTVDRSTGEIEAAFPAELDGQPLVGVGLGVRNPGLTLEFAEATQVETTLFPGGAGYDIQPPTLGTDGGTALVETIDIRWSPEQALGTDTVGGAVFTNACAFEFEADRSVLVTGSVTVNLVGLYGSVADPIELWGSEIEIQDLALSGVRTTFNSGVPIETGSWGRIKGLFGAGNRD